MISSEYNESRGRCPISHASSISIWGAGVQLMLPCKAFLFRNHSWTSTSCVRGLHSDTLWLSSWAARARNDIWVLLAIACYRLSKGSVPRAVRWLKSQVYGEVFSQNHRWNATHQMNLRGIAPASYPVHFVHFQSCSSLAPYPIISVTFIRWVFPW